MKALLQDLQLAVKNHEFPLWEDGWVNAITGCMKMTGFKSASSVSLVIESVYHCHLQNMITRWAVCFSSSPVEHRTYYDDKTTFLELDELNRNESTFQVPVRGETFTLDISENLQNMPFESALLFTLVDTVGAIRLAADPESFIEVFNMDVGSKIMFECTEWKHPTDSELFGRPVTKLYYDNDVYGAAVSLIEGKKFESAYPPNTNWRANKLYLPDAPRPVVVYDTSFLKLVKGNPEIKELVHSLRKDAVSYTDWVNLGKEYYDCDKTDLALKCFETAFAVYPGGSLAYKNAGILLVDMGEYDKALDRFRKCLDTNPESPGFWVNLASAYLEKGEKDKGLECLLKASAFDPDEDFSEVNMGFYLLFAGKPDEALVYIEKAIEHGDYSDSYLNKAHVYLIKGEKEKAIDFYTIGAQGFEHLETFWNNFNSDFKVLTQYGITKKICNGLKRAIKKKLTGTKDFMLLPHFWLSDNRTIWITDPKNLSKLPDHLLKKNKPGLYRILFGLPEKIT